MTNVQLVETPIDTKTCMEWAQSDTSGAVTTFVGHVRDHTDGESVIKLIFEAYKPMAIKEMEHIATYAKSRFKADKVLIHHRIGTVPVGGIAVLIAVSTPHREAAFKACKYCIDTLKDLVPIWKKEYFESGEVWVAAHP